MPSGVSLPLARPAVAGVALAASGVEAERGCDEEWEGVVLMEGFRRLEKITFYFSVFCPQKRVMNSMIVREISPIGCCGHLLMLDAGTGRLEAEQGEE